MPFIDLSQTGPDLEPGVYRCEIIDAKQMQSKKGDWMLIVDWLAMEFPASGRDPKACSDFIMLGGKGAAMGVQKLAVLGFDLHGGDEIEASQLIGKRAWLDLEREEYQGQVKLKVQPSWDKASGGRAGYWPDSEDQPVVEGRPESDFIRGRNSSAPASTESGSQPDDTPF